jgi:hypothetical protein
VQVHIFERMHALDGELGGGSRREAVDRRHQGFPIKRARGPTIEPFRKIWWGIQPEPPIFLE